MNSAGSLWHSGLMRCGAPVAVALLVTLSLASGAAAGERYALIVTGASGGDVYEQKYAKWRDSLVATLREKFHYVPERIVVLAETESDGVQKATRANVQRVLADLRKRMTKDDQLLVLLIGHGTSLDGDEAKFNLVGPALFSLWPVTTGHWGFIH